tara:strand:- start:885 stop:1268 length:384 start_codon:yes stop_codon:yes gene_type:complete
MNPLSIKTARKLLANVKAGQSRNKQRKSLGNNVRVEDVEITHQDIIDKFDEQGGLCFYSKLPLQEEYNYVYKHPFAISVERIDNKQGYLMDNVRLTRRLFNLGRGSYDGDFQGVMDELVSELKDKKT